MTDPCLRAPALRPGDTIALISPSRPSDPSRLTAAVSWLEERGYQVRAQDLERVQRSYHYLGGTDQERADHVMSAFLDKEVAALLCVRGGFGTGRMLDRLDYGAIAAHPKPVIGFSDSTGLQLALYARTGLVSLTGALADTDLGRRPVDELVDESLWRLAERPEPFGSVAAHGSTLVSLRPGRAEGRLVAGNLALLCSLMGSPYQPPLDGAVLLVEDVAEAPYRVDRMLTQLRLAGIFDRIHGLALGTFADCFVPEEMEDSPTLAEIVDDAVGDRDLPVLGGVAYGHTRRRSVLPIGPQAVMDVGADASQLTIVEPAVI